MPVMVRLSKNEEKGLVEKCRKFNKILCNKDMRPMQESELVHKILALGIQMVKLDAEGKIYLEE